MRTDYQLFDHATNELLSEGAASLDVARRLASGFSNESQRPVRIVGPNAPGGAVVVEPAPFATAD